MRNVKVFESEKHLCVLLNESDPGEECGIRSNQYLIMHAGDAVLLDPGGLGVMPRVLAELLRYTTPEKLKGIFLSHQDPDIVAGIAMWLNLTRAPVYISEIWTRFIPHYGIKDIKRLVGVPDEGMQCAIAPGFDLQLVPAHFLHSQGQMNVYDPISKVLFSGDIGAAALSQHEDYAFVDDFGQHLRLVEPFHRRYMCSNRAARVWVETISDLDINVIAPQHGPIYRGKAVSDFIRWFKNLKCGADLISKGGHFLWEVTK